MAAFPVMMDQKKKDSALSMEKRDELTAVVEGRQEGSLERLLLSLRSLRQCLSLNSTVSSKEVLEKSIESHLVPLKRSGRNLQCVHKRKESTNRTKASSTAPAQASPRLSLHSHRGLLSNHGLSQGHQGTLIRGASLLHLALIIFICFALRTPPVNGSETAPYFIVALNVCNSADALIYDLQAIGHNLSFNITEGSEDIYLKGQSIFQAARVPEHKTKDISLTILVTGNVTGEGSDVAITKENRIFLRLKISDVYCFGRAANVLQSTIVIVVLASVSLLLLTGLAFALIVLVRKKTFSLRNLGKTKESGAGGHETLNSPHFRDTESISQRSVVNGSQSRRDIVLTPNGAQRPRKSSLKSSKLFETGRGDNDVIDGSQGSAAAEVLSFSNGAFDRSSDDVQEMDGSPVLGPGEPRRKSVVTFADTAQVRQISAAKSSK